MRYQNSKKTLSFCFQNVPADLSVCVFVLDQCLSVRALQEMLADHEDQYAGVGNVVKGVFML